MIKSGYFKKKLSVNLSAGTSELEELPDVFLENYVGGRGFGAKLIWDNLCRHNFRIDPLEPDNLLVVAPGPFTGAYLPASGKTSFITLSPATGIYGDSSLGGSFGVELRQAGVDLLAITGRAPVLSILFIDNNQASVIPCRELKGKSCLEAEGMIKNRLGTHGVSIAVIGVAGEKLINFACVNTDWSRNAGRTGIGSVMGSKNLKAIVVRGDNDLPVHDLKGLISESNQTSTYLRNHPYFKLWQREGLMTVIDYANSIGILPTYNFKDSVFSKYEKINSQVMLDHYKIGDTACFACPMGCGNICLVKDGKYGGIVTEGPEYESCAMLGSNLGIEDYAVVLAANRLCDELGLDTISTGNIIGAVIEGYEMGIITLEELDHNEITWGDDESILELIRKIANREGIGDVLADGAKSIINRWPEMEKLILQVKGLEQSAYDSRAAISMALAYATSDIGAHHTRAWTIARELEEGKNWSLEEKIDLVIYHQTLRPLFDMLGACRLPWIELGLNERHYENFYHYITGNNLTLEDLLALSRKVYDLTRLINNRLGISRKDDTLPYKVSSCPALTGPNAGKVIDTDEFEKALTIYYNKRGWTEDGCISPERAAQFEQDTLPLPGK